MYYLVITYNFIRIVWKWCLDHNLYDLKFIFQPLNLEDCLRHWLTLDDSKNYGKLLITSLPIVLLDHSSIKYF